MSSREGNAEKLRVEQSDSAAVEYLRRASTIEEMNFLTSEVIVLGTVERTGLKRVPPEGDGVWLVEVVLVVEQCLKGRCGERHTRRHGRGVGLPGHVEMGRRSIDSRHPVAEGRFRPNSHDSAIDRANERASHP